MKFATTCIHVGQDPDPTTGATIPPVHFTTTYTLDAPGESKGFVYSRSANPTRVALEKCIAALEGGAAASSFSSGCAATMAVLSTLRPGDSVVAYADLYGGTYRIFENISRPNGVDTRYAKGTSPADFESLIDASTKLIWLETPTNPLLRLIDIDAVTQLAKSRGIAVAVDNTFATPALQQPLSFGADYVVHSTTKYIGGHSDVIGGAVIVKDAKLIDPILFYLKSAGGCPGPMDCYMTHRGIKTLPIRMREHCANASAIARHLVGKRGIASVIYPMLEEHPDHQLAKKQMCGGGGIVSILLEGGFESTSRFCRSTKLFSLAESLGGVESLINHPARMTHASIPKDVRDAQGITDNLVRLSVGIEDVDDLKEDIDQALASI
ncbi:MAG: PLP-dependent aspartate aminotransferase family protein [Phycisphaerae bacterium]|nr:PLP-dependent transferase [Phycisphaerales bacterium]